GAGGVLVQRDGRRLAALRDPGGEEMVLQHCHPAAADLLVDLAVLQVVLVELAPLVAAVIPGRAVEAERFGPGIATLDLRRGADQLAVDLALPWAAALVDDLVAHFHRIGASTHGIGAQDAHAVGAL